jgi:hypothetical protein
MDVFSLSWRDVCLNETLFRFYSFSIHPIHWVVLPDGAHFSAVYSTVLQFTVYSLQFYIDLSHWGLASDFTKM